MHNPGTMEILKVYDGYPASLAGIKAGDIITSDGDLIRGEIGSDVEITLTTEQGNKTITLIRDKICTSLNKDG